MNNDLQIPAGASVLEASGKGGSGNILLLFDELDPPRVLKVYRTRRSLFRETLRTFSQVVLEGKTGSCPDDRYETEHMVQQVWKNAGFCAIEIFHDSVPEEISDPALWLEYLPRPNLQQVLKDATTEATRRTALLRQLGEETCRREMLADERGEALLIHEHATLNHFFVDGDRLVAFDFENGYRPGFSVQEAVVQELSTLLRSITRLNPDTSSADLQAFLDGYGNKEFLRSMLLHGVKATGPRRILKRWYDRKSRPGKSKTDVMERVLDLM